VPRAASIRNAQGLFRSPRGQTFKRSSSEELSTSTALSLRLPVASQPQSPCHTPLGRRVLECRGALPRGAALSAVAGGLAVPSGSLGHATKRIARHGHGQDAAQARVISPGSRPSAAAPRTQLTLALGRRATSLRNDGRHPQQPRRRQNGIWHERRHFLHDEGRRFRGFHRQEALGPGRIHDRQAKGQRQSGPGDEVTGASRLTPEVFVALLRAPRMPSVRGWNGRFQRPPASSTT